VDENQVGQAEGGVKEMKLPDISFILHSDTSKVEITYFTDKYFAI